MSKASYMGLPDLLLLENMLDGEVLSFLVSGNNFGSRDLGKRPLQGGEAWQPLAPERSKRGD